MRTREMNRKRRHQIRLLHIFLRIFFILIFLSAGYLLIRRASTQINQDFLEGTGNISRSEVMETDVKEDRKEEIAIDAKNVQENTAADLALSEKSEFTTLLFTGDILFSQYVLENYSNAGIDGILEKELQQEMNQADITMVNQEFPFSNRGTQAEDKQFTFRADPEKVEIFQTLGIDIVTLANNHTLDFGTEALEDSFNTLEGAGIQYVGAGDSVERAKQLETIKVGDRTIGFLAASRVIPEVSWNVENQTPGVFCTYDSTVLVNEIKESKSKCDYTVVYVHWGIERNNHPEEYQRQLAKEYIDAGADIVIGSHPHVLQGIEYYNDKPVIYSLGNFIFGSTIEKTAALKVTVDSNLNSVLEIIPCSAANAYTKKMENQNIHDLYRYLEEISFDVSIDEDGIVNKNQQ